MFHAVKYVGENRKFKIFFCFRIKGRECEIIKSKSILYKNSKYQANAEIVNTNTNMLYL